MATDEVLFQVEDALGRITLTRPAAINALTTDMVDAIDEKLAAWADDDSIEIVSIEGAGGRGLCAGGDVVAVRQAVIDGGDHTHFFDREYRMNSRIASYGKPIVAWQDGIVMGGGVGVSSHASLRLVDERTKVAMPETIIGFFPDVGALHVLTRSPGEVGKHLSLTGVTIGGAEAIYAGLADAQVTTSCWDPILESLRRGTLPEVALDEIPANTLEPQRSWIDECYVGYDAPTILDRLKTSGEQEARAAGALIEARSPLAVCATLEAYRRASSMQSVDEVLEQDLVLARNIVLTPDFSEGVRAQIVDKDRSPSWSHASVEDVSPEEIEALFRQS